MLIKLANYHWQTQDPSSQNIRPINSVFLSPGHNNNYEEMDPFLDNAMQQQGSVYIWHTLIYLLLALVYAYMTSVAVCSWRFQSYKQYPSSYATFCHTKE